MPTASVPVRPSVAGIALGTDGAAVNLLAAGAGVFVPLPGVQVTLPAAGRYLLQADVRAAVGGEPPLNAHVVARLFNVTTGAELPGSRRMVVQANVQESGPDFAEQTTAPITDLVVVTAATTIRVEAALLVTSGVVTVSNANSSATNGRSILTYERV